MRFKDQYEAVFGEKYIEEKYKMVPHAFTRSVVGKRCCSRCGLLALNNNFSRWAVSKGCNNRVHPSYKNERRRASLVA